MKSKKIGTEKSQLAMETRRSLLAFDNREIILRVRFGAILKRWIVTEAVGMEHLF